MALTYWYTLLIGDKATNQTTTNYKSGSHVPVHTLDRRLGN